MEGILQMCCCEGYIALVINVFLILNKEHICKNYNTYLRCLIVPGCRYKQLRVEQELNVCLKKGKSVFY